MKELYLVYTGSGQYEDYYENIVATFETREDAVKWATENLLEVKDWRVLSKTYDDWCEAHPEHEVFDDDEMSPEEVFVKDHPEYTLADFDDMWNDMYRGAEIVKVYRLTPGLPAYMTMVTCNYVYNPNLNEDRPPQQWKEW